MDEHELEDRKHARTHWLLFAVFGMIAVCVLAFIVLSKGEGDLLPEIVGSVILVLGAFRLSHSFFKRE